MSSSPAYFAVRTLRALEMLAFGPTTPPDLARALGVHPRGTRRLLSQLRRDGWITFSSKDPQVYAPTLRLVGLAAHVGARAPLATLSAPVIERLYAETGLEASLAIPAYHATVCVVRCRGENASQPPLGEAPPAHCTATGKALLAHSAAWRRAVLAAPLSRCTERSTITPQALEREFAWIRMHGYAIEDGEHMQGVRQLAAPIVGPEGDVLAAIAVAGYAANTPVDPRDELPGRIRNAAAAASDALAAGASEYPLNRGIPYRLLASYGLSPADARL